MQEKLNVLHQKYIDLVTNTLFTSIDKEVKKGINEFANLETGLTASLPPKWKSYDELIEFKETALNLTETIWESLDAENFEEFAKPFLSRMEIEIAKFPELLEQAQSADRFKVLEEDSGARRMQKRLKNICFQLSILPKKITGKAKNIEDLYWTHKVPVRDIISQHLIVGLVENSISLRNPLFIETMKAHLALKEWECGMMKKGEKPQAPEVLAHSRKGISTEKRKIKKALKEQAESCWADMTDALSKVDTIELSLGNYDAESIHSRREKLSAKWAELEQQWINNLDVFLEDWRSDLAIHKLILKAETDLELFCDNQDENMDEYLGEELNAIQQFISESLIAIDQAGDNLGKVIKKQLYHAQKSLDKVVIPALIEKLGNKNLVNGIDRLLINTTNEMEKLTEERKVPKVSTEYLSPLATEDITTMSPYELIAFEISPELSQSLEAIKTKLLTELNENLLIAQDLDHVIAFGLNAALDELEDEDADHAEVADIAITSLKRAESRANDVKASLQKAMDLVNLKATQSIKVYQDSLNKLTENENVKEIRLRIMRAKALKQTEEYKAQLKGTAKTWFAQALNLVKAKYQTLRKLGNRLSRHLITDDKEMDVEVANFLIDSEKIIDALPVIYRNLYQIHPVSDLELFVGREQEQKNLSLAYNNWCNKKKGAAIIIGEKWSGLTSFINYTEHADLFNHPCNRFNAKTSFNSEDQIFEFLSSIVFDKPSKRTSWDELAQKLKSDTRRVIIIEDIQCLYIRKVGGFDTLTGLASLVHQTSGNVFWIMTSTIYAWNYLKKTIGLNEAFRFEINFINPSTDQVQEIIKKRSRISGYKIHFKPSEEDEQNKKYLKLSDEERQRYLRDRFFNEMISFASGNISMALMFWLLSTAKVTEDTIEIGAFKKPDFLFLQNFSPAYVFALHQLVLHDGLNLEQFASVSRTNEREATILLLSLQEDGILLEKGEYFVINPLIYRSVISLLTSKNLMLK